MYTHEVSTVTGTHTSNVHSVIEYKLFNVTSNGVCITCTFLDSSTTDCVAVVHQRISQLSSSGLMNIESSHKFNRSGDTASGCITVSLDEYQIGVIGAKQLSINGIPRIITLCLFGVPSWVTP